MVRFRNVQSPFIIGAVFKKGTRRDPDSFLGQMQQPPIDNPGRYRLQ